MGDRKRLRYGMVGGGIGAFIGAVHRRAIALEETADLVAGCFSSRKEKNQKTSDFYGIAADRLYASYEEMARAESTREDGIDFVSIVTPNATHYEVAKAFLLTPMTLTARLIKKQNKNAKVVFIGPCAAKKLEAMRRTVKSEVDFVLTFEEMTGIFAAKNIKVELLEEDPAGVSDASADGRNFAVSGGVAKAVENVIHEKYPDREVKIANAEGLKECRKLLTVAKAGKYNGYLLEGMACPGGCVAGAGTMQSIKKSQTAVNKYAAMAGHTVASQTEYVKELEKLVY